MRDRGFDSSLPPAETVRKEQLCLFLLDGSYSMNEEAGKNNRSKALELSQAIKDVIVRLQSSARRNSFYINLIFFGGNAKSVVPTTKLVEFDVDCMDYNPLKQGIDSEYTRIGEGLKLCKEIANNFLNDPIANITGMARTVVIVILTDGMSEESTTMKIANELKSAHTGGQVKICTSLFTTNGLKAEDEKKAVELLQNVASGKDYYLEVYDAESIRDHFLRSISE